MCYTAEEIREKLSSFIEYEEGQDLRNRLKIMAVVTYIPKFDLEAYLHYMNSFPCSFDELHPQDTNHPYYWSMFSVPSQHVYGDCVEECLDKAIQHVYGTALRSAWTRVSSKSTMTALRSAWTRLYSA